MFIRNGVLDIISRHNAAMAIEQPRHLKKLKNYLHSIRFRIFAVILLTGIIPMMIINTSIMKMYSDAQINTRIVDIQSHMSRIARSIGSNGGYLDNNSKLYNDEIELMSDVYDGRIMVINSQMRILIDTYVFEEGKTLISEGALNAIKTGSTATHTGGNDYMELFIPIVSETDHSVLGAIVVMLTTSDIGGVIAKTNSSLYVLRIVMLTAIFIMAVVFSRMLVEPVNKITKSLKRYSNGYEDERIEMDGYTETKVLAESFNKMLDKMQKLDSSRQEFVSNVSHELKTPITSIKVLADSLNGQEDVPVELYKEFMNDIVVEIDRENKIINDLLSLVRLDRTNAVLNITTVNINSMLEIILRRLKPIAGTKDIELVFESFRPVTAEVDEVKLTLAISNLVENAIKYNIENGWVKVSLNSDHQYFYVKVEDSGIGIPAEAQDKIFERFYRVDKARSRETGGTGLGLSIVKNIIIMHKGSIKLYSKEDEGTTFTIRIPLSYVS